MFKRSTKLGLTALTALTAIGLASCGEKEGTGVYTLREFMSGSPTNWNPHTWEMSNDTYITSYCEMGFVDVAYDPATKGYQFVYEMATDIKDVTQDDKYQTDEFMETYNIGKKDTQRVWQVTLNPAACWADGTKITADDYIESAKRLLDPKMKNYRANNYYSGDMAVQNAYTYYSSDSDIPTSVTGVAAAMEAGATLAQGQSEDDVFVYWDYSYLFNDPDLLGDYDAADFSADGGYAYYGAYPTEDETLTGNIISDYPDGTLIDDEFVENFLASNLNVELFGGSLTEDDVYALAGAQVLHYPPVSWEDAKVGIVKVDDYKILYIGENPISEFNFKINNSSLWLVKTDLYDANKSQVGNLTTTTYGTTFDKYMGFGPYKLASFEKDKQITFVKNDKWYGWTDGKHEGQYKTTNIVCDIIPDHQTALLAFQQGKLDSIELEQADLANYGYSDYLLYTPETYTMRLVFLHDLEKLETLEQNAGDGKNRRILHNYNFRKAFNLAMDRARFNAEATAGHQASFGILNTLYYYDVENNPQSVYRNTDVAKQTICDLYGMDYGPGKKYATLDDAYKAVTGFDLNQAKQLFQQACDEAIAEGYYTKGQDILFNIGLYDATTATSSAQINILNEFITAATAGTDLAGKITLVGKSYNGDVTRYDAIGAGSVEIANCAWGGAAFYPFSTPRVYCDPTYADVNELASFDPTKETFTVEYDWNKDGEITENEKVTKTYQKFAQILAAAKGSANADFLNGGVDDGTGDADLSNHLYMLSQLEYNILDRYNFTILGSYASVSLFSKKINYATREYSLMYGYGGIRFLTYNYDDAGWNDYVNSVGGKIDYK